MKKLLAVCLAVALAACLMSCDSFEQLDAISDHLINRIIRDVENRDGDDFASLFYPDMRETQADEIDAFFEQLCDYYEGRAISYTQGSSPPSEMRAATPVKEDPGDVHFNFGVSSASASNEYYVLTDSEAYVLSFLWEYDGNGHYGLTYVHIAEAGFDIAYSD